MERSFTPLQASVISGENQHCLLRLNKSIMSSIYKARRETTNSDTTYQLRYHCYSLKYGKAYPRDEGP